MTTKVGGITKPIKSTGNEMVDAYRAAMKLIKLSKSSRWQVAAKSSDKMAVMGQGDLAAILPLTLAKWEQSRAGKSLSKAGKRRLKQQKAAQNAAEAFR